MTIERYKIGPRFAQAVTHGGTVYISGQVPDDWSVDIAGQTEQVLGKVNALLAEAGSSRSRLLQVSIYLKSMDDFAAFNEVWDRWIDADAMPSRACVEAPMANPGWLVEIVAIAAV